MTPAEATPISFPGFERSPLYDLAVQGARQGSTETPFAALLELKKRGATATLEKTLNDIGPTQRSYFEERLAAVQF